MSKLEQLRDTHYEGINKHDLDLAASMIADDVVTVTPQGETKGLAAFREFGDAFLSASPDAAIRADATYEVGDTIITEGVYSGTHTGDLATPDGPIPPTGRKFSFAFVDIMQVADDKVVNHRIYWDNLGFMAQLGLVPG